MPISPFFHNLRVAYQAEINDLTFDSEGQDVLVKRLKERRKELGFLLQMMELSPEMVAVIFHQGFEFKKPAVMDQLLSQESACLPAWGSLADAIVLPDWAQELSRTVLKEPRGDWFLTVAAGLEYMYSQPGLDTAEHDGAEEGEESDETAGEGASQGDDDMGDGRVSRSDSGSDGDDDRSHKAREAAAADWMAEQGFDRKE